MIQSHFTTSHVYKYLHLFRQLKDIYFHFSTAGCLFSLLFFSFVQLYDPNMTHCVSYVSHSPACVAPGPGPVENGGFYRLNPSSFDRFGVVWGWDICGSGLLIYWKRGSQWLLYLHRSGSSSQDTQWTTIQRHYLTQRL